MKYARSKQIVLFVILISCIFINSHMSAEEINQAVDSKAITCGSILRIQNIMTKFHLHSHQLTWGSGSRQQSITSVNDSDDSNSLWIVKEQHNGAPCETGVPLQCDQLIRLEHVNTGKNLHSHDYKSFITDSQEASGFGDDGTGDIHDNFQIQCYDSKDKVIKGSTKFYLYHPSTLAYAHINIRKSLFNETNCRGCPILGQREVSLTKSKDIQCVWKVVGGMIFNDNKQEEINES